MTLQRWLDDLRHELDSKGLPASYSARLIEELTDHYYDNELENRGMEAQPFVDEVLGNPKILASVAQQEFAGRTFAGRHPILTFILWPIPAAFLMLIATTLVVTYPSDWLVDLSRAKSPGSSNVYSSTTFVWLIAYFNFYVLRFIPFILTSCLFAQISRRANSPMWGLTACVFVACFAFAFRAVVESPIDQRDPILRIGLCFEGGLNQWQNGLVQMAIPLAMGLWAWRKHEKLLYHCKRPLFLTLALTCLFTIACFVIPPHLAKQANITVFVLLTVVAIVGSIVCIADDRLELRLR